MRHRLPNTHIALKAFTTDETQWVRLGLLFTSRASSPLGGGGRLIVFHWVLLEVEKR